MCTQTLDVQQEYRPLAHLAVAPFMGAWIEISSEALLVCACFCRTLHGCVD